MKAKTMFEKLGYEESKWEEDHTIEYLKYIDDDFFGKKLDKTIIFHKRNKRMKIIGVFKIDELQAINKQIEELGWSK